MNVNPKPMSKNKLFKKTIGLKCIDFMGPKSFNLLNTDDKNN